MSIFSSKSITIKNPKCGLKHWQQLGDNQHFQRNCDLAKFDLPTLCFLSKSATRFSNIRFVILFSDGLDHRRLCDHEGNGLGKNMCKNNKVTPISSNNPIHDTACWCYPSIGIPSSYPHASCLNRSDRTQ